jgi:hypothetical protein
MNRPTLQEIRKEALDASNEIAIAWETLSSDPLYRSDFERTLTACEELVPDIEQLYVKLVRGENVLEDGEETAISYADREMFLDKLEDELYASYQVLDLWNRYQLIESITTLDKQSQW